MAVESETIELKTISKFDPDGSIAKWSLQRPLNLLAADFDQGEIHLVRVPIQTLGNLFEILRLLRPLADPKILGFLKRVASPNRKAKIMIRK